jgi:tRNA acetyltransferase TAN1
MMAMPLVLVTVVFGKEEAAKLEVLDCIYALDPNAHFLEHKYGGLLILETEIASDAAAEAIERYPTSQVFKVMPVDSAVKAEVGAIVCEVLRLVPQSQSSVSVVCQRRGRAIASSHDLEVEVGSELKSRGHIIDLENPQLVVRIDIIGERATISVRPPASYFIKRRGN